MTTAQPPTTPPSHPGDPADLVFADVIRETTNHEAAEQVISACLAQGRRLALTEETVARLLPSPTVDIEDREWVRAHLGALADRADADPETRLTAWLAMVAGDMGPTDPLRWEWMYSKYASYTILQMPPQCPTVPEHLRDRFATLSDQIADRSDFRGTTIRLCVADAMADDAERRPNVARDRFERTGNGDYDDVPDYSDSNRVAHLGISPYGTDDETNPELIAVRAEFCRQVIAAGPSPRLCSLVEQAAEADVNELTSGVANPGHLLALISRTIKSNEIESRPAWVNADPEALRRHVVTCERAVHELVCQGHPEPLRLLAAFANKDALLERADRIALQLSARIEDAQHDDPEVTHAVDPAHLAVEAAADTRRAEVALAIRDASASAQQARAAAEHGPVDVHQVVDQAMATHASQHHAAPAQHRPGRGR